MLRRRVVATDIDMTLTDAELRLDTKAIEKIRKLEAGGIRVILVSGRNIAATGSLAQFIGTCGLIIAESGGVIARHQAPMRILAKRDAAKAALQILKRRMGRRVQERSDSRYGMRLTDVSLERSFDPDEATRILQASSVRVRVVDTGVAYQLLERRADKGRALKRLARMERFSLNHVTAVGDNYNDLDLFRVAGYRIAVANAPEAVKAQADYVCSRSYGQGFLEAVAHIGL